MSALEAISDLMLERYALGELPAHAVPALEARIEADPVVAERLRAIRSSDDEVLDSLPPAEVAREVERRLHLEQVSERHAARASRRWWLATSTVVVSAAAALLLFVVVPDRRSQSEGRSVNGDDPTYVNRAKGDPGLLLHVKRDGRVERLEAGAMARSGDLVQISYRAAGRSHGVVLSIDGGGAATLHYPATSDGSTALDSGSAVGLQRSYELDDAPAFERFFFVTADAPIDVNEIQSRARALAADADAARERRLDVPPGLGQTSFLLRKETPR